MFVDESTSDDYLLMCAVVAVRDVNAARTAMRALLLPGQRSLHMKNERNRAEKILAAIVDLAPQVTIYRVDRTVAAMEARGRCVRRLAHDAVTRRIARVVLDPIDSVVERDRSWIIQGARDAGHHVPPFDYHHQKRHEEPLLWIADAVGWAWARSGSTRAAVSSIVTVVDL